MSNLNDNSLLRLPQIIGDPKAKPPIFAIIPVSKSNWWASCRDGRYPPSVKLSALITCWRATDIARLVATLTGEIYGYREAATRMEQNVRQTSGTCDRVALAGNQRPRRTCVITRATLAFSQVARAPACFKFRKGDQRTFPCQMSWSGKQGCPVETRDRRDAKSL